MTKDLNINLRPSSGLYKSPKEIVQFYNNIDGWQEILPKTDNTYSPESKYYKYEVSPGIPFIPNMSRIPLKSYEKTPMKNEFSEDYSDYIFTSSHIKRKLFTSTTYKHYKGIYDNNTHTEIEETLNSNSNINIQSKISKVIKYVYRSVEIFIKYMISYFIFIFMSFETYRFIMELGSNVVKTSIRKIINFVHLTTITMLHYDLIIITTVRKIIDNYFENTRTKNLAMIILFSIPIFILTVGILNWITSLDIPVWQDSWTNFLVSPFINILNLMTSISQIFISTMLFVLDLIFLIFSSSLVAIKLFGHIFLNIFQNVNTIVGSATQINTIPVNQNPSIFPFDYNMLAKKIVASEEFQRLLIDQLNVSQSDVIKLHDVEFQQFFKNQLQEMNSENLNWINNQLKDQQIVLKNINNEMFGNEKEAIQLIEKKISELQNIVSNLINNFEIYKSNSENFKKSTESITKEACYKNDWHSIISYIEQYVNMTMKSTLSIYDADKTGMVDYALESAGATVLGTRCTQTKSSTAALTMLGIPLWFISNGPRLAIQPGVYPGQCWAFIGAKGFLILKLSKTIHVTGFTIEHLPKSLSEDGHIRSAPKDFSVWGLKHETDSDGKLFGNYQFKLEGPSLQYFSVMGTDNVFSIVELRIESNHGHEEYTCLYRIRVHGNLA